MKWKPLLIFFFQIFMRLIYVTLPGYKVEGRALVVLESVTYGIKAADSRLL